MWSGEFRGVKGKIIDLRRRPNPKSKETNAKFKGAKVECKEDKGKF